MSRFALQTVLGRTLGTQYGKDPLSRKYAGGALKTQSSTARKALKNSAVDIFIILFDVNG